MGAIVPSTVWPGSLGPTPSLVSSTRLVTLWRSAPAAPLTDSVSTATGLCSTHTPVRDLLLEDGTWAIWKNKTIYMYCFDICCVRSWELDSDVTDETQQMKCYISTCCRLLFMISATTVSNSNECLPPLNMMISVFCRMEQNECECPCECPLEVNECTGNLTNAENRSVLSRLDTTFISSKSTSWCHMEKKQLVVKTALMPAVYVGLYCRPWGVVIS